MTVRGRVVLLNGRSSAGKSSIGRAMMALLDDPWFLDPVDAISGMRSTVHRRALDEDEVAAMLLRTRRGYHRAVAALARAGNDVVMDYPLSEPWRLLDLLEVLDGLDVLLVDVTCDPGVLERRERDRGDRPAGLARSQDVFAHDDRDLVVDTTTASPEQCAVQVVAAVVSGVRPAAFERLRRRLLDPRTVER